MSPSRSSSATSWWPNVGMSAVRLAPMAPMISPCDRSGTTTSRLSPVCTLASRKPRVSCDRSWISAGWPWLVTQPATEPSLGICLPTHAPVEPVAAATVSAPVSGSHRVM